MMTDWHQRSINALQLNGKGERTQEAYTRAVRMLSTFYSKAPDEITEPELEAYFLRRRNVDPWSPNPMRICSCGIRFFFVHVLQRHWHLFDILRAKSGGRLPAILSQDEVRGILRGVRTPHNHAFLSTVYACGLRLQEAQYLEVSDIDSQRMMIHVHRGKGAKDRFVPLPRATLAILRTHWRTHRNPRLLFPACGRDGRSAATATTPMAKSSVQGAFRHAKRAAGVGKRGVSVHMRRFLQHVLPRGFMKVRYYGFLSPSSSVPREDVKARIEMASGFALTAPEAASEPPAALRCRHCGGTLRFYRFVLPADSAIGWLASLGQRAGESATLSAVPAGP